MAYPVTRHGVKCHITVLEQCKCTVKFHYIYFISMNVTNMFTVAVFGLIYVAFERVKEIKCIDFSLLIIY